MATQTTPGARLRELMKQPGLLLRPCAYDALSAVLIERAGFPAMGTTGYGISAGTIGQPDMGFIGYGEMIERVRTIINATNLPVDVDADTGYGNSMNVYWTVWNMLKIGAASIRIEDQTWPKRCGHMQGKGVISTEEMLENINAAVRARNAADPSALIGARTDAYGVHGFEDALARAIAYAKAGADYVYIEAPQTLEEIHTFVEQVPCAIAMNIIPGGRTPPFEIGDLERVGVKFLSVPMICLYPATKAIAESLKVLAEERDVKKLATMGVSWKEFNEVIGVGRWRDLEQEVTSASKMQKLYGTTDRKEIEARESATTDQLWRDMGVDPGTPLVTSPLLAAGTSTGPAVTSPLFKHLASPSIRP